MGKEQLAFDVEQQTPYFMRTGDKKSQNIRSDVQQSCPDLPDIPQSWLLDMQKLVLNDGQNLVECFPEQRKAQSPLA